MRTDDFNYVLPEEMIAQTPLKDRTASKMMVLDKQNGNIVHSRFYHLIEYLKPGDVLVFNNTRVLPARLYGIKEGGTAHIEVLLLKRRNLDEWSRQNESNYTGKLFSVTVNWLPKLWKNWTMADELSDFPMRVYLKPF